MANITFSFESGTTQDDMILYVEKMREQLTGKVSEEELEHFISNYISSIANAVIRCDGCGQEIPSQTHHSCKKCGLKFDLCKYCQSEDGISGVKCPEGFGCTIRNVGDNEKIFIPKQDKSHEGEHEKYSAFGETYVATESKLVNIPVKELLDGFSEAAHYPASAIYVVDKEVSHKLLEDFWLFFRTTNCEALGKYGEPLSPIRELPSYKLYQVYAKFLECFSRFIALDDSNETMLMMRIIYPNGDTFIVKRVHKEAMEKMGSPFSTCFIRVSDYLKKEEVKQNSCHSQETQTDYVIDSFREQLEKITNKTIEELNEIGQVLLVAFSVGN